MKSVFNVDWLSIYGESYLWGSASNSLGDASLEYMLKFGTSSFEVVPLSYGSKQFAKAFHIIPKGASEPAAHLQCCPRAGILNPKSIIIKISNYLLYTENLIQYIDNMLYELHITSKSISRLDLALDFCRFENGWLPERLIKDFLSGRVIHKGQGIGRTYFIQSNQSIKYTGLQFGSKTSIANVYLYNKTLELTGAKSDGHHDKPHIRETWNKHGIISNGEDVWRLEVSFKPEALKFADADSGEVIDFTNWSDIDKTQKLFNTFVNKLFCFVYPTNKNITRCKKVNLFGTLPAIERRVVNFKRPSTMADKIFIKSLLMSKKYTEISNNPQLYEQAARLAFAVVNSCDLEWWWNKVGQTQDELPDEIKNIPLLKAWLEKKLVSKEWQMGHLNI